MLYAATSSVATPPMPARTPPSQLKARTGLRSTVLSAAPCRNNWLSDGARNASRYDANTVAFGASSHVAPILGLKRPNVTSVDAGRRWLPVASSVSWLS